MKTKAVVVLAILLASWAVGSVLLLEHRANETRDAQLALAGVKFELSALQVAPFRANPRIGGSPVEARKVMQERKASIAKLLEILGRTSAPASVERMQAPLRSNYDKLDQIYVLGATSVGDEKEADYLAYLAQGDQASVMRLLDDASGAYDNRARIAQAEAIAGSAVVILALLGAFAFFYLRSIRVTRSQRRALGWKDDAQRALHAQELELRTALAQLEIAQLERQRLLERTVQVAEHERIRVAIELHDGPIQQLTAVALNLDRVIRWISRGEVERAGEITAKIRNDLAREMDSLRRLMAELRPPIIDEGGLSAALESCAAEVVDDSVVECVINSTIGDVALAEEIETVVYRVAREALINVRKHSLASRVDVVLESVGDKLRLTVADNGRGFPPEKHGAIFDGDRYGLLGMRERVESVGGVLVVESTPGAGVRIEATLPSKPRVARSLRTVDRVAA